MLISFFIKHIDDIDDIIDIDNTDSVTITSDNTEFILNIDKNKNKDIDKKQCCICFEDDGEFYNYKYNNNKFIHNCKCQPVIHYNCFKSWYYYKKCCIICLENIDQVNIGYFKIIKKIIIKLKFKIMGFIFLLIWIDCVYLLCNLHKNQLF